MATNILLIFSLGLILLDALFIGLAPQAIAVGTCVFAFLIAVSRIFRRTNIFKVAFLLAIIVFFSAELLGGIFSEGPLTHGDFPFHAHIASEASAIARTFGTLSGWSDIFQGGYRPIYDLPQGEYLASIILEHASFGAIGTDLAQRILVFLAVPFSAISLVFLARRLGLGESEAFLSGIFFLLSYHNLFYISNSKFYISAGFLFLFLGNSAQMLAGKPSVQAIARSATFLSLCIIFHSYVGLVATFLAILIFALQSLVGEKPDLKGLVAIPLGILPGTFYITSYFGAGEYLAETYSVLRETWSFIYNFPLNLSSFFFFASPIVAILFLASATRLFLGENRPNLAFPEIGALSIIACSFSLNFAREAVDIGGLKILGNTDKAIALAFALASVGASKEVFSGGKGATPLKIATIALLSGLLFSYFVLSFSSPESPQHSAQISRAFGANTSDERIFRISRENGIFSSEKNHETVALEEFLRTRARNSSRILLNINGDSDGHVYGGFAYSRFPERIDSGFVGGPSFSMVLPLGENFSTATYSDKLFGRKVSELSPEDFGRILKALNIRLVVAWNPAVKEYVSSIDGISKIFETPSGLFSVYEYYGCSESYLLRKTDLSTGGDATVFSRERKVFRIGSPGEYLLSQRYSGEWRALLNGEEMPIKKGELGLTEFHAPVPGEAVFEYVPSEKMKLAGVVSVASFLFLLAVSIFPEKLKAKDNGRKPGC